MELLSKIGYIALASDLPKGNIISISKETLYNLFMQLGNTLIIVAILAFILYKPVRDMLDKRKESISAEFQEAATAKKEAEELKKQLEEKLLEIEGEKEKILAVAHKKALERSDHIIKEAKEEAEYIHHTTMAELKEQRNSMEDEIKRQLIELSILVAGKFVETSIDDSVQNQYIEEALENWEEGLWLE